VNPKPAPRRVVGSRPHAQPVEGALRAEQAAILFLPCAMGVEPLLESEAGRILGDLARVQAGRGGVEVHPRHADAMVDCVFLLNLESRLAQRVLWRVAQRIYRHEDDIYAMARQVNWAAWINARQTLRVDVTARRSPLKSLNFAALRVKDAVCDVLREATGERPSVDTHRPDLSLVLHLDEMQALLYVDTSGEALFKRGWREDTGEAPLKETLAAAMLAAADWQGRPEDGPLLDPCCGAGTIPIEAAQIACDIAPGLQRRFAFERLQPFRAHLARWQSFRETARQRRRPPKVQIFAGDVSFRMTDFATRNAERAGVRDVIEFKTADALQRPAPVDRGIMMFNPPYGERIDPKGSGQTRGTERSGREDFEDREEASSFFLRLAAHWKKNYTGWTAWVLSPDMKLPGSMRLKETRRTVLFNGPIECRLFRFDMVAGAMKPARSAEGDSPSEAPHADI